MKYYYCYLKDNKLFETEIKYAKMLGLYIFYDESVDIFYDEFNNPINIKGMNIFPRTGISQVETLLEALNRHQGNSLVNQLDYEKTLNWPHYIKTIRNNIVLTGEQIINNPNYIRSIFGNNKIFFKTKKKNYSQIIDISTLYQDNSPFIKTIKKHINDEFIISDEVFIEQDKNGPLEYRAFIINGNIYNISRISNTLLCTIPKEVIKKTQEIISNLKETDFPKSYVIDLFIYKNRFGKKEVDVLECNPIIASGIYLYNSVIEKIKDLEHVCPSASIPKEKTMFDEHNKYSFNIRSKVIPSIYYKLPGGFASDLVSFSIFDQESNPTTYIHLDTSNINFLNFQFQNITLLNDEDIINNDEEIDECDEIKDIHSELSNNEHKKLVRIRVR